MRVADLPLFTQLPLSQKSSMVIEKIESVDTKDVNIKIDMGQKVVRPAIRKGKHLSGIPQLESSIKNTWTTLNTFIVSYQTQSPYEDPFVFEQTGQIYYGQWKDELPEGKGFLYTPHTSLYQGSFRRGLKDGRARIIFKGGDIFSGNFTEGRHQGDFKYSSPNFSFEGVLIGDKINGVGVEKTIGYTYRGTYVNGKWSNGELCWQDNIYNGDFNYRGQFHGKGELKSKNGTYKGQFKMGMKDGNGQFQAVIGWRYVGSYLENQKHGKGSLFRPTGGLSYEGDWDHDLPHGSGFTVVEESKQPICQWVHGISKEEEKHWQ